MATGSQYLNGRITVLATRAQDATEILTFTIPSAGTWTVDYFITIDSASPGCVADLFDSSNTYLANSRIAVPYGWSGGTSFTANKTVLITTTGPETFKLKGWGGNTSNPQPQTQYLVSAGGAGVVYLADPVTIAKGDKGDTGPQGIQGIQGPVGPQGIQGPIGDTGPAGPVGPQGSQGPQGQKGDRGLTGANGTNGTNGLQGPKGETGPVGLTGPRGLTGLTGPKGDTGARGPQGIQGIPGPQGPAGATGAQGPQGPAGNAGPAFIATMTAGFSIPVSSNAVAQLPLTYNNVIKNDGLGFNINTGVFTAPRSGYYQVSAGFAPGITGGVPVPVNSYGAGLLGIYKNNAPIASGPWIEARSKQYGSFTYVAIDQSSVSRLIYLNAQETLHTKVAYITNWGGFTTFANVVPNHFQAVWIRD